MPLGFALFYAPGNFLSSQQEQVYDIKYIKFNQKDQVNYKKETKLKYMIILTNKEVKIEM